MTLQQYPVFYRKCGIRRPDQLVKPPLTRLELLDLPRNSIYHYLGTGPLDDGPTDTENALKSSSKPFTIETVTELKRLDGHPRRLPVDINRISRSHRAKNPRFRPFKSLESAVRDPESMLVYNYSYIHRLYKYMRNYFTGYYRWTNLMATAFDKIAELAITSDRHQFIEFDLPQILPSLSQLRTAQRTLDQKAARIFSHGEAIILLQMWEWLGPKRENSFISQIPINRLDRVNLVLRESGRWFVVNLGQLNNWRRPTKEEIEKDPSLVERGYPADRMQKLFIRLAMSLFEARTGNVEEPTDDHEAVASPVTAADANASTNSITKAGEPDTFDRNLDEDDGFVLDSGELQTAPDVDGIADADIDAQVDADLEKLEDIGQLAEQEEQPDEVFDISTVIPQGQTLEDAVIARCNALADSGGLSAAEYRKYLEIAGTYKSIAAPDGSTMDKFIQIPKEVLAISESPAIPDKKTVVDKTMLKSSLLVFDEVYIKEVMQKDIASMVMNLQNAGIIVQDYQIEEVENVSMAYYSYTVKVKPLQGATSTLRFRIPKVNEDGTFRVNNVNYRSRKQRGD